MLWEAQELQFDSCVVITGIPLPTTTILPAIRGWIIDENAVQGVVSQMRKVPVGTDLVMVEARDTAFNRAVLSLRGIHILRGIHRSPPRSFDPVSASLASRSMVAVDLDLSPLLFEQKGGRQRVLQRYEDILQLHRRLLFPLTISTGARSILGQRSVREIISLCALFGMEVSEVTRALATCGRICERIPPVKEVV